MGPFKAIAFHHAGGSALSFGPVVRALDKANSGIELVRHEHPGRGGRMREPLIRDGDRLLEDAFERCREHFSDPYVLVGHSLGARVAALVARRVKEEGLTPPRAIVLSGSTPHPHSRPPTHHLPEPEFIEAMEHYGGLPQLLLDDPDMMAFFLPVIRADMEVLESMEWGDWRLSIPMGVLHGTADTSYPTDLVRAWVERTDGPFRFQEVPGGHFFPYERPDSYAQALRTMVDELLRSA